MTADITLEINGYKSKILRYNYGFHREIDCKGRPGARLQGGSIYVEMESDEDTDFLEMMLHERIKKLPDGSWEPRPVSGKIEQRGEDMMLIRELVFEEAYIYCYGERMNAEGNEPMTAWMSISTTRLDINRSVQLDRRITTTSGFGWEKYKEEEAVAAISSSEESTEEAPECTVFFRRSRDYDGSFGFDWLRVGDTSETGCGWYRDSMRAGYDRLVASEYRSFEQQWRKESESHKDTARYVIPWVTLMKGVTATFRIKMEVNKPSGSLDIRLTGGGANALSVNLKSLDASATGDYYHSSLLKVTCNSEFSQETALEVRARGELVGKMIFIPNHKTYPVDIAIVTVKIRKPNGEIVSRKPSPALLDGMKRLLQQVYIIPHFHFYDLDLSQPAERVYNKKKKALCLEIEKFGGEDYQDGYVISPDNTEPLVDILWRNGSYFYPKRDIGTNRFKNMHRFFHNMLHYTHSSESRILDTMIEMYFVNERIEKGKVLNGEANRDLNNAFISLTGYSETIAVHELLHVFSLNHPKDESTYIFKEGTTENIMDYDINEDGKEDRISLWYWQIKKVWSDFKKKYGTI